MIGVVVHPIGIHSWWPKVKAVVASPARDTRSLNTLPKFTY
jgi:hypothetical protein